MKIEQTECSESSANKIQTPGNYPAESIQISVSVIKKNSFNVVYRIFALYSEIHKKTYKTTQWADCRDFILPTVWKHHALKGLKLFPSIIIRSIFYCHVLKNYIIFIPRCGKLLELLTNLKCPRWDEMNRTCSTHGRNINACILERKSKGKR